MIQEKFENVSVETVKTSAEFIEVAPGVFAFKRTQERKKNHISEEEDATSHAKNVSQGFVDQENKQKMLSGRAFAAHAGYVLLTKDSRDLRGKHGNAAEDKAVRARISNGNLTQRAFDALVSGEAGVDDVVHFNGSGFGRLRNGDVAPHAVFFDYISNGRVSNLTYDLNKLVSHLMSRSDVRFHQVNGWRGEPDPMRHTKNTAEVIGAIPSYNADDEKTQTVSFIWTPSQEDLRRIWEMTGAESGEYALSGLHKLIFDQDLLGLRACGAALCDDYYADRRADDNDPECG